MEQLATQAPEEQPQEQLQQQQDQEEPVQEQIPEDDLQIQVPFISQAREKRRRRIAEQKENRKKMKINRIAAHPSSSEEEEQSTRDLINKEYKALYSHILPKDFQIILHNEYHDRRKPEKNIDVCDCNAYITPCCGSNCINRLVFVECTPGHCICKDQCTNQTLQRGKYADVEPFVTDKKGVGLKTKQDLKPGEFVIEYVGEVISNDLCLERLQKYKQNDNKFYFLTLDANECIDAKKRGNLARFINHSCNPNCQTQKWFVQGEMRVGIFAIKNIPAGTELTFDYQFERFGEEKQECFCGESNCRGYLGEKQKQEKQPKKKSEEQTQSKAASETWLRAKSDDHNAYVDELTLVVSEDKIRSKKSKPPGYDGFIKSPYRRYKRHYKRRVVIPFLFRNRNTNRIAYRKDYNFIMTKEIERLEKMSPEQFFSLCDE